MRQKCVFEYTLYEHTTFIRLLTKKKFFNKTGEQSCDLYLKKRGTCMRAWQLFLYINGLFPINLWLIEMFPGGCTFPTSVFTLNKYKCSQL